MDTNQFSRFAKFFMVMVEFCVLVLMVACESTPDGPSSPQISDTMQTPLVTFTLTASPSSTISPTHLPTFTSAASPSPSYSPEEIQAQIDDLLATNGYCQFPCWWGLMPGETTFDEAQRFVAGLSESSAPWINERQIFAFSARIPVPEPISLLGELYYRSVSSEKTGGLLRAQAVFGYAYTMTEVLEMLSEPSDIQFTVSLLFYSNTYNFDLFLFYPEDGIIVRFISQTTTPDPETEIRICDLDTKFTENYFGAGFLFWNPQENITFDEAIHLIFLGGLPPDYASLENISNMDPHTFYINFSQPDPACLVIDTSLFAMETAPD
jgi:hypothetical protein